MAGQQGWVHPQHQLGNTVHEGGLPLPLSSSGLQPVTIWPAVDDSVVAAKNMSD